MIARPRSSAEARGEAGRIARLSRVREASSRPAQTCSGVQVLLIGSLSAAVGYGVGRLVSGIAG